MPFAKAHPLRVNGGDRGQVIEPPQPSMSDSLAISVADLNRSRLGFGACLDQKPGVHRAARPNERAGADQGEKPILAPSGFARSQSGQQIARGHDHPSPALVLVDRPRPRRRDALTPPTGMSAIHLWHLSRERAL